jgi:hypothetical protein
MSSPDDNAVSVAKDLVALCRAGRLYDIQNFTESFVVLRGGLLKPIRLCRR